MSEQVLLLLEQLLSEQQKTNHLLCLLIDALADGDGDTDNTTRYLDGSTL